MYKPIQFLHYTISPSKLPIVFVLVLIKEIPVISEQTVTPHICEPFLSPGLVAVIERYLYRPFRVLTAPWGGVYKV